MTMTDASVYYDMYDRDIYAAPHEVYRRLRDDAPLYYNEAFDFYVLSRHEDLGRVLGDRETFISGRGMVYNIVRANVPMPEGLFICEDAPQHTVHRALVSRLFTPRAIGGLEPRVRALCEEVTESLVGRDGFDFMKDFAVKIPVRVIGMLVGLPEQDQAELHSIFHRTMNEGSADVDSGPFAGAAEIAVFFNDYLDWREKHPTEDVMSQLLTMEFDDVNGARRKLRRSELVTYLTLISSAGSDTTAVGLGWAAKVLADHPDQRRALLEDPQLIPAAVDEVLRLEPPSYHFARTSTKDATFHGQTIPAGSVVILLPGAANRDERVFPNPDVCDVQRAASQYFTFSFGAHFCLGASLARLEMRIALEHFLPRFPQWSVDEANASLTSGIDTRGWEHLPLTIG